MLRVFKASGEAALTISYEAFVEFANNLEPDKPVRVLAVLRHLQRVIGQTRFKQRLLVEGQMLVDDALLDGPLDAQLVLLPFQVSCQDQIQQLQQSARDNATSAMEQLRQRPQDPDLEHGGWVALHSACYHGCAGAVRLLLEANADVEKSLGDGAFPMFVASHQGHLQIVQLLLQASADIERPWVDGRAALCVASQLGHLEIARLLLEARADKDKTVD